MFRSAICNGNKLRCLNSYEITGAMNGYPDTKGAVNAVENYILRSGKISPASTTSIDGIEVPALTNEERAHNLALKAIARPFGMERLFANA